MKSATSCSQIIKKCGCFSRFLRHLSRPYVLLTKIFENAVIGKGISHL